MQVLLFFYCLPTAFIQQNTSFPFTYINCGFCASNHVEKSRFNYIVFQKISLCNHLLLLLIYINQAAKHMSTNNQPPFLGYLHSFRGFAIINIVVIHAVAVALYACNNNSPNPKDPYSVTNELLFHNSTIYFAVISGLLFSVVLKGKGYKKFYSSKFKNVLLPYLFLTLIFSIFNPTPDNPAAVHTHIDLYLNGVLRNFVYGKAQLTYWYIPVLIFLYLVTPLLDYLMNLKRWGTALMLLIILAPLVVSRVELIDLDKSDFLSLSTMIYFTGAYAAGMYLGTDPEKWFNWVKENMRLFITTTVLSTAALIYFEIKGLDKIGSWSLRATLFYIQKMCLSGIFIVIFNKLGERQPGWINRVANNAFAIYFLHAFFLLLSYVLLMPVAALHKIAPFNLILTSVLFFFISLTLSIFITWIFKKLFGKYSRMLVGS